VNNGSVSSLLLFVSAGCRARVLLAAAAVAGVGVAVAVHAAAAPAHRRHAKRRKAKRNGESAARAEAGAAATMTAAGVSASAAVVHAPPIPLAVPPLLPVSPLCRFPPRCLWLRLPLPLPPFVSPLLRPLCLRLLSLSPSLLQQADSTTICRPWILPRLPRACLPRLHNPRCKHCDTCRTSMEMKPFQPSPFPAPVLVRKRPCCFHPVHWERRGLSTAYLKRSDSSRQAARHAHAPPQIRRPGRGRRRCSAHT
jgi:hypothetical protein